MSPRPTRLKHLLRSRHWQVYSTFCAQYDKAARDVDPEQVGCAPSRAQFNRWVAGELAGLPHPGHCRILEAMFPGWTARRMFEPWVPDHETASADATALAHRVAGAIGAMGSNATPGRGTALAEQVPRPRRASGTSGANETFETISRRLITLGRVRRLAAPELDRLAALAGNLVELSLDVDIDIAPDGHGRVCYRRELLNLTTAPLDRVPWELWFENPDDIEVGTVDVGRHQTTIERIYRTPSFIRSACLITPAVQPGESATISYFGQGCRFLDNHYWGQAVARHTRQLTICLRHRDAGPLRACTVTIEHADGAQTPVPEAIDWYLDGNDAAITLTYDHLKPTEVVTVRWERAL